jgi:LysM repeat protein
MKRRTRLITIGCAALGTIPLAANAAFASTNEPYPIRVYQTHPAPQIVETAVRTASPPKQSPPPKVAAPLPRVTVAPGDSLSAIGVRVSRTWPQLAGYNHIPNPNLIYPKQILTIPPANYVPVNVPTPAPVVQASSQASSGTGSSSTQRSSHVSSRVSGTTSSSAPASSGSAGSGIWGCIAQHESGGNPATNTGNGFYGAFQDTIGSWRAAGGGPGLPSDYSYAEQLAVNQRIQAQQGWGAWPNTSRMCGL